MTTFKRILKKNKDLVFNQAYFYTGSIEDAEDITQEVFIKLYTGLNSFKFQSSVWTWAYRIAVNHCLNFLRSRRHFVSFDEVEAGRLQVGQHDIDVKLDLRESLQRISGATRTLLLLKYVESYTYEEIAELTGLGVSAVKMRISRARQSLARKTTG